ncbi:MAG: hypothetical protein ABIQ44_00860, partial [Chloroflexia bacterium]
MTRSSFSGLKGWATVLLAGVAVSALVACNGPTVVDTPASVGDYGVVVNMDPQSLVPPQLSTISYALTDNKTGKPLKDFAPIYGALFHNVLISRDLEHFKHTYTNRILLDSTSIQTYFPVKSKYTSYGIFEPAGTDVNVYAHTIQAGGEGDPPALTDEMASITKVRSYGLQIEMLTGPSPVRVDQDAQIAFYITEFGQPVTGLWPFLDEAGYLWMVDGQGSNFTWEVGTAATHKQAATGSPTPSATVDPKKTVVAPTNTPTVISALKDALATHTAQPVST